MYEEFKQMTDEELLSIVNLKTGHYTHDELQAAREEFIRRMYREPLSPEREVPQKEEAPVFKEEIKAEPFFEKEPEDFVPPVLEEEMREYLTAAESEFLKESTKEVFEAPQADKKLASQTVLRKLFVVIGKKYSDKNGGYTRIYHLPPRRGDASEMALIQLV